MATLLARIRVKAGMEARWEEVMTGLVESTLSNETQVIRYEYWKGQEPGVWYALESFTDKYAFFVHQDADYHRSPALRECIETVELEFLDPVQGASPLPRTENPPLPDDAPEGISEWENRTPVVVADWWKDRI